MLVIQPISQVKSITYADITATRRQGAEPQHFTVLEAALDYVRNCRRGTRALSTPASARGVARSTAESLSHTTSSAPSHIRLPAGHL